jgi:ATPase subunit of ABC transporter with duplicated ATPase domains
MSLVCFLDLNFAGLDANLPTSANHLDLPAIVWLQSYLENETEDQTVVIVSHDRNFLDAVTDETIIFRDKKLAYHAGNYEDWERTTEEQRKRKTRLKDASISSYYIFGDRHLPCCDSLNKNDARKSTPASKRMFNVQELLGMINVLDWSLPVKR